MAGPRIGVLLDVDGTLLDSNYFHVLAWWRAFRDADRNIAMSDIHRCVGMGSDRLIETLLGEPSDRVRKGHSEHWAPHRSEQCVFPGAVELVRACAGRGALVALATSAEGEDVDAIRNLLGCDDVIEHITSSAEAAERKPAPDILEGALTGAGLAAENSIFIGDTVWDIAAAKRAGLPCVALLTGGISRAELLAAGAVAVYESAQDLLDHLDDSPVGALLGAA